MIGRGGLCLGLGGEPPGSCHGGLLLDLKARDGSARCLGFLVRPTARGLRGLFVGGDACLRRGNGSPLHPQLLVGALGSQLFGFGFADRGYLRRRLGGFPLGVRRAGLFFGVETGKGSTFGRKLLLGSTARGIGGP